MHFLTQEKKTCETQREKMLPKNSIQNHWKLPMSAEHWRGKRRVWWQEVGETRGQTESIEEFMKNNPLFWIILITKYKLKFLKTKSTVNKIFKVTGNSKHCNFEHSFAKSPTSVSPFFLFLMSSLHSTSP